MNQSIISIRYAKALMMVGNENRCLDALKTDFELLGFTVGENDVFKKVLDNPVIKPQQKRKALTELLEKRIHPLTLNFINLIIRNRREFLLPDVARDFIDLYEKSKGIKRVRVVSAARMDDADKQQLRQQLNVLLHTDIHMITEDNPNLIGGFILRVDDQQYDASLLSALKRMQKTLSV